MDLFIRTDNKLHSKAASAKFCRNGRKCGNIQIKFRDLLLDFFDLFLKLLDLVAQLQVLLVRLVQDGLFLFVLGLKSPDNLPLHDQFLLDFI